MGQDELRTIYDGVLLIRMCLHANLLRCISQMVLSAP